MDKTCSATYQIKSNQSGKTYGGAAAPSVLVAFIGNTALTQL